MFRAIKSWNFAVVFGWATVGLALFPILTIKQRSLAIIIWTILTLISGGYEGIKKRADLKYWALPIALFVLQLFSLIYTQDVRAGLFVIEKSLPLLVFPIMLIWNRLYLSEKQYRLALVVYVTVCLVLALFVLIAFLFFYERDPTVAPHFEDIYKRDFISRVTRNHPTYLSVFFLFAALICIHWLRVELDKVIKKIVVSLVSLLFIVVATFMAARMPLIAFAVALLFQLLISNWSPVRKMLLIVGAGVIGISLLLSVSTLRQRTLEVIETKYEVPRGEHFNSTNLRVGIFYCTKEAIISNLFWGVGVGSSQHVLNQCLYTLETDAYQQADYNTHNQFLGSWLAIGLPGLAILVLLFVNGLWIAWRQGIPLLTIFLIFTAICFQTEEVLSRQAGIIFFMYFYVLFNIKKPANITQVKIDRSLANKSNLQIYKQDSTQRLG